MVYWCNFDLVLDQQNAQIRILTNLSLDLLSLVIFYQRRQHFTFQQWLTTVMHDSWWFNALIITGCIMSTRSCSPFFFKNDQVTMIPCDYFTRNTTFSHLNDQFRNVQSYQLDSSYFKVGVLQLLFQYVRKINTNQQSTSNIFCCSQRQVMKMNEGSLIGVNVD